MQLASQLVYVAACDWILQVELKEIQSLIMKFIWRGRPPKVAESVLCQKVENGGLRAINTATLKGPYIKVGCSYGQAYRIKMVTNIAI